MKLHMDYLTGKIEYIEPLLKEKIDIEEENMRKKNEEIKKLKEIIKEKDEEFIKKEKEYSMKIAEMGERLRSSISCNRKTENKLSSGNITRNTRTISGDFNILHPIRMARVSDRGSVKSDLAYNTAMDFNLNKEDKCKFIRFIITFITFINFITFNNFITFINFKNYSIG